MTSDWLDAIADAGSLRAIDSGFEQARPSPHLARWSIATRDDDGVRAARLTIVGLPFLAAAHAATLERLFVRARDERCAVLLLLASGGVRLHEANPAEVAAARALHAMIDARAAGVPIVALCIGDVFGGASVLACATDRLGMVPAARLGLS